MRLFCIDGQIASIPFLDISTLISSGAEQGLLDIEFHPNYLQNHLFYVHYTDVLGHSVISEFMSSSTFESVDIMTERVVLTVNQPIDNHNGGQMEFGSDGYLYIALGDGGGSGDPSGHGQDLSILLGSILRIDVSSAVPYTTPASNPFVGMLGVREEIWAYGLRNPWRFSFDRNNGRLFAGDVGEVMREEISLVVAGGNYGWNTMEGTLCFPSTATCNQAGLELPITEYGRSEGVAIIGGYVYRGNQIPGLYGAYLFADFISKKVWSLRETSRGVWSREEIAVADFLITSFGEDVDGEIYLLGAGGEVGKIVMTM